MAFQTPITIKKALTHIHRHEYVLPAIQREFVWKDDQIARLFDSLLRGYPIGAFLFWRVERENTGQYKFYDFVRNYHQKKAPHCPPLGSPPENSVIAVLDGQQRLTALNIGLRGSLAIKEPRKWWTSDDAFPEKRLYLNLLAEAETNDAGMQHDFRFLTPERADERDETHFWFPVAEIMAMESGSDLFEYLLDKGLTNDKRCYRVLETLHSVIHKDGVLSYFEEESQDLDKVLNIFIRTNSGGTVLSYSDLLLSIATAQWEKLDAREEIHGLVDELNDTRWGFGFSKDFVLKTGLMLSDIASVGFKVTNFNRANMLVLEENWGRIAAALRMTVRIVADFGFSDRTLGADSALLPIAYHVYQRRLAENYLTNDTHQADREALRGWLVRSLLKSGVWGSGLDTLLTAMRTAIQESGGASFPVEEIETVMASRGKSLRFEDEELDDLADTGFGDRRCFSLLALLYPYVDLRHEFHVDHIFPGNRFSTAKLLNADIAADRVDEVKEKANRVGNLQLLDAPLNMSKQDRMPHEWIRGHFPAQSQQDAYADRADLGVIPESMAGFETFYDERRARIRERLEDALGAEIVTS